MESSPILVIQFDLFEFLRLNANEMSLAVTFEVSFNSKIEAFLYYSYLICFELNNKFTLYNRFFFLLILLSDIWTIVTWIDIFLYIDLFIIYLRGLV